MLDTIKKEVKKAFVENKMAIVASALILFVAMILGYVFEPQLYSYLNPVVEDLNHKVQTGVVQLTFNDIFFNNLMVLLKMFIGGMFFCFSAALLAFNGFFAGYYVASTSDMVRTLALIIPHGIFEFTSCILGCASGFVLFNFAYRLVKTSRLHKEMGIAQRLWFSYEKNFGKLLQAFILLAVSIVLMVIAGIIETYFTLSIAKFFLSGFS